QTASLVRAMSRAMLLGKCKAVLGLVLAVGLVAGLGAAMVRQSLSADRTAAAKADPPAVPPRDGPHPARTDRLGDPLPPGALFRLGSLRLRNKGGIHSAAFAAGGRVLATAGDDGEILLWDPATGKELRRIDEGRYTQAAVCSPDGKALATLTGD